MGVCCGTNQAKDPSKLLRLNTEQLAEQKPIVMEADIRKSGPNPNSLQLLSSSKKASENGSAVLRWQKVVARDEAARTDQISIQTETDKLVERYCKRLQLSSPENFGDDSLRADTMTTCSRVEKIHQLHFISESSRTEHIYNVLTQSTKANDLPCASKLLVEQRCTMTCRTSSSECFCMKRAVKARSE